MPSKNELLIDELNAKIARQDKIIAALMAKVERGVDLHGSAFSQFEGNALLAQKVKDRTKELKEQNAGVLAENAKLARVLCTLPGRIVLFDQEMNILNSFHGTGPRIPLSNQEKIDRCFCVSFVEKLTEAKINHSDHTPASFSFVMPEGALERHYSCYLSEIGPSEFVLSILDLSETFTAETQLKQQEMRLVQAAKLSALGEMAGGVAHEINNPLAIISIEAHQAEELLQDAEIDRNLITEKVKRIESTTARIAKIVQGLRMFSRNGSLDAVSAVSVADLMESTLSFCRERFQQNGVTLSVGEIPDGLSFEGRDTEISQVILNLLNNAFDAIAAKAEKWVKISTVDLGNSISISITDSGSGIPNEIQERIFQPFFTTKEIGKGTGLGLSISHGIVKNHGGTMALDAASQNTCFKIVLPKTIRTGAAR